MGSKKVQPEVFKSHKIRIRITIYRNQIYSKCRPGTYDDDKKQKQEDIMQAIIKKNIDIDDKAEF